MTTVVEQTAVVNEDIWNAWIQRGKLQERASMRKLKIGGRFFLVLLVVGTAFFAHAGR